MRSAATITLLLIAGCAPMTPEEAERSNRMWAAVQQSQAQTRASAPAPYMLPTHQVQQYQPAPYMPPVQAYQPQPMGVSALFTGRSRPVQTITNQSGWECVYQYNGQSFTRVFTTTCPATVAIQ